MASPGAAQSRAFVGPSACIGCHDHQTQKQWAEQQDGDGKGKRHLNALNQLDDKQAGEWARKLGVADVYDVKSPCVKCHATVVKGSVDFGVTCESCHGPASDYLKPHQDKGAYQSAVSLGMRDVVRKPERWVRDCLGCHVLGTGPVDSALVAAGHPSGARFDLASKFSTVALHYKSSYAVGQIAGIASTVRDELTAGRTQRAPIASASVTAPPPAAVVPTSAVAAAAAAAPKAPPVPARQTPPPPSASTPATTPVVTAIPARSASPAAEPVRTALPAAATPRTAPPPDTQVPQTEGAVAPRAVDLQESRPALTPVQAAALAQGRLAIHLAALLRQGTRASISAHTGTRPYGGPDSALLRLQQEIIALALDALAQDTTARAPARN